MLQTSGRILSYEQKKSRELETFPAGKITITKLDDLLENNTKMEKVDFKRNFYIPSLRSLHKTLKIIKGLHSPDKGLREKVSIRTLKRANKW